MHKHLVPMLTARLRDLSDHETGPVTAPPEPHSDVERAYHQPPPYTSDDPADRRIRRRRWSPTDGWDERRGPDRRRSERTRR